MRREWDDEGGEESDEEDEGGGDPKRSLKSLGKGMRRK